MDLEKGMYYLGSLTDPAADGEARLLYESSDLTTHGMIVGMTGSGKTGLGIDLIEEAILGGVPCLVIDPKGDMGNLLLSFPDFRSEDFRPWIDEAQAAKEGVTPDELAASTAGLWKSGLEKAGITGERLRQLNESSEITIYTPGSGAGVGLNVLGSLEAPDVDWSTGAELARDEIEGLVSSLLLLADIEADPVSDPRHILLATIIEHAWSAGQDLDLAALVGQIPKPPFRRLGVFELDTFFPEKDRMALAMRLNGLLASPSFASWLEGVPLDIDAMLGGDGRTPVAVVYLAHLSETERQFIVTLLLGRLVTWFRGQSGTSGLRALVYMDEVFGYVPPVREPPTKKAILTILKQARAFGVGMVLSTQNPVDIDYKALSNTGTWMIGRLQTETDKKRLLEGLNAASGGVDTDRMDDLISALEKRQFILHTTGGEAPRVFGTRWAQSYLAGPLTRDQVTALSAGARPQASLPDDEAVDSEAVDSGEPEAPSPDAPAAADLESGEVPVMPPISETVSTSFSDPAAGWLSSLDSNPTSATYAIGAAATVQLLYDDQASGLDHQETYEAILFPLGKVLAAESVVTADHDDRDFLADPPGGVTYLVPEAPVAEASFWAGLEKDLKAHLVANRSVQIFKNAALKLYSRPGESEDDFAGRCEQAADDAADAELAKLKDKYATRIDRVKDQLARAETRVRELEIQAETKKQDEVMSGVGDLLGGLLGGKAGSSTFRRAASRRSATRTAEARAEEATGSVEDKMADLRELELELEEDVNQITAKYQDLAGEVEPVAIGLEASDVRIAEIKAVWIPV